MDNTFGKINNFRKFIYPIIFTLSVVGTIVKIFQIPISHTFLTLLITSFGLFAWLFLVDMVAACLIDPELPRGFKNFAVTMGTLLSAFFGLMWISYFIPQEMKYGLLPYSSLGSLLLSIVAITILYFIYNRQKSK